MKYIKRLAYSTTRVTQGKIYEYDELTKCIEDDAGLSLKPCLKRVKGKYYWMFVSEKTYKLSKITDLIEPIPLSLPKSTETLQQVIEKHSEKPTMLRIKKTVTINGEDIENYETDRLIKMIRSEEEKIESLDEIKSKSKAIAKLRKQHEENILLLIEVLDGREE